MLGLRRCQAIVAQLNSMDVDVWALQELDELFSLRAQLRPRYELAAFKLRAITPKGAHEGSRADAHSPLLRGMLRLSSRLCGRLRFWKSGVLGHLGFQSLIRSPTLNVCVLFCSLSKYSFTFILFHICVLQATLLSGACRTEEPVAFFAPPPPNALDEKCLTATAAPRTGLRCAPAAATAGLASFHNLSQSSSKAQKELQTVGAVGGGAAALAGLASV